MKKPCPVPPDRAKIFYLGNAGLRPVFPFLSFMICIGALKALGLLRRPHKKCLRAVRHGPHFVLKHETTFFTPGSALRIRQVSLGWTRDSVSGLCQEAKPPGPIVRRGVGCPYLPHETGRGRPVFGMGIARLADVKRE